MELSDEVGCEKQLQDEVLFAGLRVYFMLGISRRVVAVLAARTPHHLLPNPFASERLCHITRDFLIIGMIPLSPMRKPGTSTRGAVAL